MPPLIKSSPPSRVWGGLTARHTAFFRLLQSPKAPSSVPKNVVSVFGKYTSVQLALWAKAPMPIDSTCVCERSTFLRLQVWNAFAFISFRFFGKVTVSKALHSSKALSSINVMLSGNVISFNLGQLLKHSFLSAVSDFGKLTSVRFWQSQKMYSPRLFTLLPPLFF